VLQPFRQLSTLLGRQLVYVLTRLLHALQAFLLAQCLVGFCIGGAVVVAIAAVAVGGGHVSVIRGTVAIHHTVIILHGGFATCLDSLVVGSCCCSSS